MTRIDEADGLTVSDVTHSRFSTLPAAATVGDVRAWFAESAHRRMALLADGDRYAGSLLADDLDGADPARAAAELARAGPTVAPEDPASRGAELALRADDRRIPVVDHDGRLLGIVAITTDLQRFCGT
jgi:CBS domain-containing protein